MSKSGEVDITVGRTKSRSVAVYVPKYMTSRKMIDKFLGILSFESSARVRKDGGSASRVQDEEARMVFYIMSVVPAKPRLLAWYVMNCRACEVIGRLESGNRYTNASLQVLLRQAQARVRFVHMLFLDSLFLNRTCTCDVRYLYLVVAR